MAFPRLNALSLWLYVIGAVVLLGSFGATGGAAYAGWTSYTPLSGPEYSPEIGQDLWILGLHLVGVSSLLGAINFLVTIANMRTLGHDVDANPALRLVDGRAGAPDPADRAR